jgi:superfamily II DNA or RNA helicase
VKCVLDLVRLIRGDARIIIFGERIETADEIYEKLLDYLPNEVGIYHSGVHKSVGELALKRFEDGEIRILVSCKTLDEGLSITSADVGIIVSSTNSTRQRIQRLGRILRKKESGRLAYFYYLYIHGTTEESDILRDYTGGMQRQITAIDLDYNDATGELTNSYYSRLIEPVILRAVDKNWNSAMLWELERNLKKGLITCDWWLTPDECEEKISSASSKTERNYYTDMLYLIRERKR